MSNLGGYLPAPAKLKVVPRSLMHHCFRCILLGRNHSSLSLSILLLESDGRSCHIGKMNKRKQKPEMQPRELKDGSGWYVLVKWGDLPSEQVGGFQSENEARQWIIENSSEWFRAQMESSRFA